MKNILANRYDAKNNSFTIVAIICSILIVYYHCYPLLYGSTLNKTDFISENVLRGYGLGSLVVNLFFITSGFLITFSLKRTKKWYSYVWKRIKRVIIPLVIVLLLTAFIIVPLFSPTIGFSNVIKSPSIWFHYVFDNATMIKPSVYAIGDCFANNPYPSAINGSIWTLKHQFLLYMIVLILFKLKILEKRQIFLGITICVGIFYLAVLFHLTGNLGDGLIANNHGIGILTEFNDFVRLTYYFFSGVLFNLYSDKISINKPLVLISLLVFVIGRITNNLLIVSVFVLPYLVISLCSSKLFTYRFDISYEIYIVAFPVQQMIIALIGANHLNIVQFILISILGSVIVAFIIQRIVKLVYYIMNYLYLKLQRNNT